MKFDDSLFVIEEQNLFVDEVRETQRWISVYESLEWDSSDSTFEALTTWTSAGLEATKSLASQEDGPLGYGSKPEVFAIMSRVIHASAALTRHHTNANLRESIDRSLSALHNGQGHMSGLLLQPLEKTTQT
jgi:hypothetical protein